MKEIKILAIGNSFSVDSMEYLYQVLSDMGVEKITLGNLYIGGCSLERHLQNIKSREKAYIYYKNTDGIWMERSNTEIEYGIKDEEWDIVTLQQASHFSGIKETYKPLDEIVSYVKKNQNNAKLLWHMTWAYAENSTHPSFVNYNKSQKLMYEKINEAVNDVIIPSGYFEKVIMTGKVIQYAREKYFGDTLNRDGFHLGIPLGRYIAALTWASTITSKSVICVKYAPEGDIMTDENILKAKKAVSEALNII